MQVIKNLKDRDPFVTLPCQVSNPSSKPFLFLDHEDSVRLVAIYFSEKNQFPVLFTRFFMYSNSFHKQDHIQQLELGDKLKYNPTMGFLMDISLVSDSVTTFICSMSQNASSFGVLITLHKQDGTHANKR